MSGAAATHADVHTASQRASAHRLVFVRALAAYNDVVDAVVFGAAAAEGAKCAQKECVEGKRVVMTAAWQRFEKASARHTQLLDALLPPAVSQPGKRSRDRAKLASRQRTLKAAREAPAGQQPAVSR